MIDKADLLERIDRLLKLRITSENVIDVNAEIYSATVTISNILWGSSSPQIEAVKQLRESMLKANYSEATKAEYLVKQCQGILRSYKDDIERGRLSKLQLDYQGQVFADMLSSAKALLSDGIKDVAAVLAAGALEDTMKKYAESNGINTEGKELSEVVNALKGAGLLTATKGSLISGMVPFRNRAMHAEWSKIDKAEVASVIGFLETFLSETFS